MTTEADDRVTAIQPKGEGPRPIPAAQVRSALSPRSVPPRKKEGRSPPVDASFHSRTADLGMRSRRAEPPCRPAQVNRRIRHLGLVGGVARKLPTPPLAQWIPCPGVMPAALAERYAALPAAC